MKKKLTTVMKTVETLLANFKKPRDNDRMVMTRIWKDEAGKLGITDFDAFFTAFDKGYITSPESIRRARQKVQAENEDLRGPKYGIRKSNSTEVRNQLGYKS